MMVVPTRGLKARWAALLCGIANFLWLGPEDNHVWPVVLLSTLASALLVLLWIMKRYGGKTLTQLKVIVLGVIAGGLMGGLVSPIAALLMLLKNVRHAHLTPDFLPQQILAMLERAPLWALSGSVAATGLALVWVGLQPESCNRNEIAHKNPTSESPS